MNIAEFLEARIAEDAAVARRAAASVTPAMDASEDPIGLTWEDGEGMVLGQPDKDGYAIPLWDNEGSSTLSMHPDASAHVARHDPTRVLAECAAKRAIIDAHRRQDEDDDPMAWIVASEILLHTLAAIYEGHPDYRQEWARG